MHVEAQWIVLKIDIIHKAQVLIVNIVIQVWKAWHAQNKSISDIETPPYLVLSISYSTKDGLIDLHVAYLFISNKNLPLNEGT